ncbi:uncharacterized protein N0V89_006200 [Didymosphaeria variabile]|uniref:Uncharacterized protein n=1 Tax=Didymosphaeria variabile TaxID=1932322 RepID=A0A9W8XNM1_9PLEO|nr:uncharacterized protein N0V89_006200 [Didymosphaeria variabile]KAJ4354463.1 hypothetical protein N0V89_006200 [Didymosphaeria variabile]
MQFYAVVVAALAAAVSAQFPTNIDPAQQSALLALATALPPSILAAAATNQAAFASEVASSIAAGNTPAWYQALPTDVKSALASIYPVSTPAASTPSETAAPSSSYEASSVAESSSVESSSVAETTTAVVTSVIVTSAPVVVPSGTGASSIGTNSTGVTSVNTPTLSGSTGSPQPTEAPGAASIPSAAIGAGIAGALAFLGMLAL